MPVDTQSFTAKPRAVPGGKAKYREDEEEEDGSHTRGYYANIHFDKRVE